MTVQLVFECASPRDRLIAVCIDERVALNYCRRESKRCPGSDGFYCVPYEVIEKIPGENHVK